MCKPQISFITGMLPVKTLSFYFTGNMPEKHDNTFFKFPLAIRILL
ncbi:hypothetical protein B4099_0706 [Heyndrickxia coagulans]|uniref:Uncharacterized protein n=1 Tax=Heyndrickxia coagulans TaxID=1398 RepID=A0A150KEK3_HEYCO|nr:hypothetical protein B4099_0706 [Heyndrickxia coagulans]